MAVPVTVRKVESPADFNTFLTFPWTLYRDDPYWVPPLVSMQRQKLDRQKNTSWQHMEGDYFIAWRGDRPVGTVAAFVNHRHNEFHGENVGFFGCFEVYDDPDAASALLDTAANYVQAKGCTALRGPASFSTNEECGILIEGFDGPPVVLYPYNPPYYQRLVENAGGFVKAADLYSYHLTLQGAQASERLLKLYRVMEKNNQRRGIVARPLDTRHLRREFSTFREIYNDAWERNWGFVPFSEAELDELVANLGMYVIPELTYFAEVHGEPAGFLLSIPDMNRALKPAYPRPGKPDLLTKLQVLWHWKIRSKISCIRIPLMGVKAAYRGIGVEGAMFAALYQRAIVIAPRRGWAYGDGGWVLETNEPMIRLCEAHNGEVYRRFRFYERALTPPGRAGTGS